MIGNDFLTDFKKRCTADVVMHTLLHPSLHDRSKIFIRSFAGLDRARMCAGADWAFDQHLEGLSVRSNKSLAHIVGRATGPAGSGRNDFTIKGQIGLNQRRKPPKTKAQTTKVVGAHAFLSDILFGEPAVAREGTCAYTNPGNSHEVSRPDPFLVDS